MNKHVELVEKWLSDNNSVSLEELKANAADAAYGADHASYEAAHAAHEAADSAAYGASYDAAHAAYEAAYWVKKYKELTK
jgi:hypothetical protein